MFVWYFFRNLLMLKRYNNNIITLLTDYKETLNLKYPGSYYVTCRTYYYNSLLEPIVENGSVALMVV